MADVLSAAALPGGCDGQKLRAALRQWGLGLRQFVMENKMETTILENQMEKKMENEMETGIIYYRTLLVPLNRGIWSLIVGT